MTLQIADILIRYGAQGTVGGIMAIAMGRELGPVLVGRCCVIGACRGSDYRRDWYHEGNRANRCPQSNGR